MKKTRNKGIAILIAVVAVSALLLVSLAISDIAYKEQIISYAGKDSKIAFYAADAGAECALFYDLKGGGTMSNPSGGGPFNGGFRFSTSDIESDTPNFECNGMATSPYTQATSDAATTTFYFNVSDIPKACSIVRVSKSRNALDGIDTKIEARGYNNTCDLSDGSTPNPTLDDASIRNLERSLRINY